MAETIDIRVTGLKAVEQAEEAIAGIKEGTAEVQTLKLDVDQGGASSLGKLTNLLLTVTQGALVFAGATKVLSLASGNSSVALGKASDSLKAYSVQMLRAILATKQATTVQRALLIPTAQLSSVTDKLSSALAFSARFLSGVSHAALEFASVVSGAAMATRQFATSQTTKKVATEASTAAVIGGAGALRILLRTLQGTAHGLDLVGRGLPALGRGLSSIGKESFSAVGGVKGLITKLFAFKAVMAVATLAAAAFAAVGGGILALFAGMAKRVEEFNRGARQLQVSIEQFQELKFAAEQAGTSIQTVVMASRNLDAAKLSALGVESTGADRIYDLADAFARMGSDAERAAAANDLFGRQGAEILPFLERGRIGLKDWADELRATGNVISGDAADGFETLNDSFNEIKNTLLGFVTTLSSTAVPLVQTSIEALKFTLESVKPTIDGINTALNAVVETSYFLGTATRTMKNDLVTLGAQAGLTEKQTTALFNSFDEGRPSIVQYFTTGGSLSALMRINRERAEELTEAYLNQRIALADNAAATTAYGASIGLDLNPQLTASEQAAKRAVERYDELSRKNAELKVNALFAAGAIDATALSAEAAKSPVDNLANSVGTLANAFQRAGHFAAETARLAAVDLGFGDVTNTGIPSLDLTYKPPAPEDVDSPGGSSITSSLEYAVARAMGQVVQSDFPISMEEAIAAATLDWNMSQTNAGMLALAQQGVTNTQALFDQAREKAEADEKWEADWLKATDYRAKVAEQQRADALKLQQEQIDAIKGQRSGFTSALAGTGASAGDLTSALTSTGYTGSDNILINQLVRAFTTGGNYQQLAQNLGYTIELDGDVLGQFVVRNTVTNDELGTFTHVSE